MEEGVNAVVGEPMLGEKKDLGRKGSYVGEVGANK